MEVNLPFNRNGYCNEKYVFTNPLNLKHNYYQPLKRWNIFCIKSFRFEKIMNFLVISFCFIWIPMLWNSDHNDFF